MTSRFHHVPLRHPVAPQRGRQPQAAVDVARFCEVRQAGVEVRVQFPQPREPGTLLRPGQLLRRGFGDRQQVLGAGAFGSLTLPGLVEPLAPVGPHGRQQREATRSAGQHAYQAVIDQRLEQSQARDGIGGE